MASSLRIKRSETFGNPSVLGQGELAYSSLLGNDINGGDRLYIGSGTEINGNAEHHFVIGGKFFTDMLNHTKGVLTANSAIITDENNRIDTLSINNISIYDNTISSTSLDGIIILAPGGSGNVSVSFKKITDLADPTLNTDATNKQYVDNSHIKNHKFIIIETPSGTTTVATPTNLKIGTQEIYLNGIRLNEGITKDYTINSTTIEFVNGWGLFSGDVINIVYVLET